MTLPTRFSGSAPQMLTSCPARRLLPDLAHQADRVGQRELLAGQARDEASAANLAARLEPVIDAQQVAPRRQPRRLAFEHAPADDAVAFQQGPCDVLDRSRARSPAVLRAARPRLRVTHPRLRVMPSPDPTSRSRARLRQSRPPSRSQSRGASGSSAPHVDPHQAATSALCALRAFSLFSSDGSSSARRPMKLSDVTSPTATSSPSASSSLRAQQPRAGEQLVEERRAMLRQVVEQQPPARRQGNADADCASAGTTFDCVPSAVHSAMLRRCSSAIGVVRTGPPACSPLIVGADSRVHTARPERHKIVEPGEVVRLHPRRQDLGLPRGRRRFVTFELREDRRQRIGPFDRVLRRQVLPLEQEAHEVARLDRLDLLRAAA